MSATKKITSKFYRSREIDGIRSAIEGVKPYEVSDWISDAYFQLWDIATMPDADLLSIHQRPTEQLAGVNDLRKRKLCRRLAILALCKDDIRATLQREQSYDLVNPTLEELYLAAIHEIQQMYGIRDDEILAATSSVRSSY
jgi:hypothetical protein